VTSQLLWDAPYARGPVVADVSLPGSKSMTNRALVLAALADGRSVLHRPLVSRDTIIMRDALRILGTTIDDASNDAWRVDGGVTATGSASVDVGNAGTVLRFLPALAPLTHAAVRFDGDPAVRRRPVAPLLAALRDLGAQVDDSNRGAAPFVVAGTGRLRGGRARVDASSSSQIVSALLLAGARYDDGVDVSHAGPRPVPNAPHLAMTTTMLAARGVDVEATPTRWVVPPGDVRAVDTEIEPDLSSAAPFLAAAAVTGGEVRIRAWPATSTQPGHRLPSLLEAFGASASIDTEGIVLRGTGALSGADLDLRDVGELTPVLAAVAAVATSPSRLSGIDYLRGHETDRVAALARELSALGAEVRELDDGLEIVPKPLQGKTFSTYDDHRMVMAAAVIALVVPDVRVENADTAAKTFPEFATVWQVAVAGEGATR
jgi:3-phosphoshikimate 1-carboxyvinyltransferase